jgi:hypothetical protein
MQKFDCAVFADTQAEPQDVYDHLGWLENEAAAHGIPVHRVTQGNLREHSINGYVRGSKAHGQRYATLPLYLKGKDGTAGMLRRQCTYDYKVRPIERFIRRSVLGLKHGQRVPKDVHVMRYFGISFDEVARAKLSRDGWATFIYPFCGIPTMPLGRRWNRSDCLRWLHENYPGRHIPRSACIECPIHNNAEWRRMRRERPADWELACSIDDTIRKADGMRGEAFLHSSRVPLRIAEIGSDETGPGLFDQECEGMCGV